jgi:hypothetical protein
VAHSILNALSLSEFPQALAQAIDRTVTRTLQTIDESHLDCCSYVSPESRWGACDSIPCNQSATVHHLEFEREFCADHFRSVSR